MARLIQHLVDQRRCGGSPRLRLASDSVTRGGWGVVHSYYPMSPPTLQMNLSYPHIDHIAMPVTPDVLLLPSDLKTFIKVRSDPSQGRQLPTNASPARE